MRGEPEGIMTSPDAKATSQAQSAPGDTDHLKITGGKGIYQQESVILNAAASLAIFPSECHATANSLEGDFGGASGRTSTGRPFPVKLRWIGPAELPRRPFGANVRFGDAPSEPFAASEYTSCSRIQFSIILILSMHRSDCLRAHRSQELACSHGWPDGEYNIPLRKAILKGRTSC